MRRSVPLALVAACLAASCGGGGGGDSTTTSTSPVDPTGATTTAAAAGTSFLAALAGVRDAPETAAYVEWSDVNGVFEAGGVPKPAPGAEVRITDLGRWLQVTGLGAGPVASSAMRLREEFGIDPLAADELLTVGEPPAQAMRLTGGQDAAMIAPKVEAEGATQATTPGGAAVLALGEEGQVDLRAPFAQLGVLTLLNRMHLADGDLVASGTGAGVDRLLDASPSLADRPGHRAAAGCLGDVVAAVLLAGERVTGVNGAAALAVGVLPRGPDVVNVICVAGDAAGAAAREAALRAVADPAGIDLRTAAPVSAQIASSTVTTSQDGDVAVARAELVLEPDVGAAYVYQRLQTSTERVFLDATAAPPGVTPAQLEALTSERDGSTAP